jgi:hypothetical protein
MPTKQSTDTKHVSPKTSVNNQGQSLAIAGFAVAVASIFTNFFTLGIMAIVGLVLSIMGRVQTSRAGRPNGLALAGIIISAIVGFLTLITYVVLFVALIFASDHTHPMCGPFDSSGWGCVQDNAQDQQDNSGSTIPYRHNSGSDSMPNL